MVQLMLILPHHHLHLLMVQFLGLTIQVIVDLRC